MNAENNYDCRRCVNRSSPLCELCTWITSPGGIQHKPRFFIEQGDPTTQRTASDPDTERLARYLLDCINARVPIPTSLVLQYNKKTE